MFLKYLLNTSHPLGKKAYAMDIGNKLEADGYCNIELHIKKNLTYLEIRKKLKELNSPCALLYENNAPKDLPAAQFLLNNFFENTLLKPEEMNNFEAFSIIDWCYKSMNDIRERQVFTKQAVEQYNEQQDAAVCFTTPILFLYNKVEIHIFNSLAQYKNILQVLGKEANDREQYYFRGHSSVNFQLQPPVFRKQQWLENEYKMVRELIDHCPGNFRDIHSHMERLMAVHNSGIPTRLLSLTQNPVEGLFFACEGEEQAGEVVVLSVAKRKVKYPHSDMVSILSALALFDFQAQKIFYELSSQYEKDRKSLNNHPNVEALLQQVRKEKPAFDNVQSFADVRKNVVVVPFRDNDKILKKEDAFWLFGLSHPAYGKDSLYQSQQDSSFVEDFRFKNKEGKKVVLICNKRDGLEKELKGFAARKAALKPKPNAVAEQIKKNAAAL